MVRILTEFFVYLRQKQKKNLLVLHTTIITEEGPIFVLVALLSLERVLLTIVAPIVILKLFPVYATIYYQSIRKVKQVIILIPVLVSYLRQKQKTKKNLFIRIRVVALATPLALVIVPAHITNLTKVCFLQEVLALFTHRNALVVI